jgi:hypothetical protein
MRIERRALGGACWAFALAAGLSVGGAEATPDPAKSAAVSSNAQEQPKPLVERARAVLETYCTDCRGTPGAGGALDLDAVAEDPRLVVPKQPDASRVYQRLLAHQSLAPARESEGQPPAGKTEPPAGKTEPPAGKVDAPADKAEPSPPPAPPRPTSAEIETVRDWIDSLPARDEPCRDRTLVTPGEVETVIDRWEKSVGLKEAADTRYVSLVHLWNACVPAARLQQLREAAVTLVTALSRRNVSRHNKPLEIETLGEASAILAVRLSEFERSPGEKDLLAEPAPTIGNADLIPADWLAAEALRAADALHLAFDGVAQSAVADLARLWTRDVDLVRAAAERASTQRDLLGRLARLEGDFLLPAQKLTHGTLSRAAWNGLSGMLDGHAGPAALKLLAQPSGTETSASEIDVLLWTDQPFYRPRELVTLKVSVGKACHLTLINIDRDGKALVLFPNELEQDNLIAPGVVVQVPGRDAGYQVRFDRSGEEQFVAICQRKRRRPEGIDYDYERQRFAALGDWRAFLRATPDREKAIAAREANEAARRKRRGRKPAEKEPPAVDPDGPDQEGRAAIAITIDPGKM